MPRVAAFGHRATLVPCLLAALAAPLHAQQGQPPRQQTRVKLSGSVETGAAAVQQPLVRTGAAFYVSPSAQVTARDATIGGNAVLATGTPVWQSFLGSGFVRSPAVGGLRAVGTAQLLKTTGLVPTLHGDAGAEWRVGDGANTVVARVRGGQMRYAGDWYKDIDAGASVIRTRGASIFALDATFSAARRPTTLQGQLGLDAGAATTFLAQTIDLTPRMIWERSRLRADASLALRAAQSGVSGTRVGPQLSFTYTTARGMSLFLGGAQRLPDARSGIPAGRSVLLGVRLEGRRLLSRDAGVDVTRPQLHVENGVLVVDAGALVAAQAQLRGDFTDWQPRACLPRGVRFFACGAAPPAGTWRVSVKLNDGAWQHPGNLATVADDFGSVDGVLMTGGKH